MQTLRKRTSPCKYKNDPSRFLGEGITFKAKLIGILEVSEARGDKMCQDALNDLKTAIRAAGEHKQRITISISIDGLRLRDEKTGDCLYHHPVHKISFIAQDMSDSRAFGYIFGSPDTGHRFFGIKTDKTASQVVISMRDLFQVVFELKKKEIEMAKHHSEQHHLKYGSSGYMDALHFPKDDGEAVKCKYAHHLKSRCVASKTDDPCTSDFKTHASEAIADLLDLEHELNSIQQGITQMEKITPSDPFGPISKSDPYIDPFDDSFSAKTEKPPEDPPKTQPAPSHHVDDPPDREKHLCLFPPHPSASNPAFFSHFSPGTTKPKPEDPKWFDQETESLFAETAGGGGGGGGAAEPTSSPIAQSSAAAEGEQQDGKKSPVKTDLFTELDPLGTGRVKPYVDKKDFFQELKNPPKKVLKELITETAVVEPSSFYIPSGFKGDKTPPTAKSDSAHSSGTIDSAQGFTSTPKYAKIDPFEDSDPFDKTDPFQEETYPSLFSTKASADGIFDVKASFKFETKDGPARADFPLFPSTALRVSLPPEKIDPSPDPHDNPKTLRRKNYHALKQTTMEGSEDSPVHEEPFTSSKVVNSFQKPEGDKRTPCKDRYYSLQSPPPPRNEKPKIYSSVEATEVTTPDPPPRVKTSLFFIKPPPLPPKKAAHAKPPARPPSLEDHYDYLGKKDHPPPTKDDIKCIKLKKHILAGSSPPPPAESKKHNSDSAFPLLPPPPHRKPDSTKTNPPRNPDKPAPTPGSILDLKLNQLDNTGLENLAITLGIPSENIYSMTLQELTKMLAEKYLISETKPLKPPGDSFVVDFDANFAKMDAPDLKSTPSYDKYAVFKELMENETKTTAQQEGATPAHATPAHATPADAAPADATAAGQEEDRYAALRQLSLSVDKCSGVSEDEEGGRATGTSPAPEDFCSANHLDLPGGMPSSERGGSAEVGNLEEAGCLFPLVDEFSGEKPNGKDNWATFEKSEFGDAGTKKDGSAFENETSPVSSDGREDVREDVREMGFRWQETGLRKRAGKDVPWQDDDESWDDYSPKESFCSDESSHEERSPDPRRSSRYEKGGWEVCGRGGERKWNGKGSQWGREKWNEETEDEFEESWRKQKERTSSCEFERKGGFWHNNCGKHRDWCNSRSEPWDENERHVHCYLNVRKRSESDNEYRKRCDSDASDKDCVWMFQKNYADSMSRSGKQKQYYGLGHTFRDCPEHCHESRPKHRKGVPQKRPSSASDSNRSYEKIRSPGEYSCRGPDKNYPPKPDKDDYFRYQFSRKDVRHRGESEFPHYHTDKRTPQHPKTARTSRGDKSAQSDLYPSPNKRTDPIDTRNHNFDYFEPFRETKHRNFHFDTDSDNFEKGRKTEQFLQDFHKAAETRVNQWASTNGKTHGDGFYSAKFPEELKASPKKSKDGSKGETSAGAEGKAKGHLGAVHRQESSATLRKSDSINIFSRDKDPFEGDDFFSSVS